MNSQTCYFTKNDGQTITIGFPVFNAKDRDNFLNGIKDVEKIYLQPKIGEIISLRKPASEEASNFEHTRVANSRPTQKKQNMPAVSSASPRRKNQPLNGFKLFSSPVKENVSKYKVEIPGCFSKVFSSFHNPLVSPDPIKIVIGHMTYDVITQPESIQKIPFQMTIRKIAA